MIIYRKLIRDKIPDIIRTSGKKPTTIVLEDNEYIKCLNIKLQEELNEYYEFEDVEELADMVELVNAILKYKGISLEEFEEIRQKKNIERGKFDKQLFLISVEE